MLQALQALYKFLTSGYLTCMWSMLTHIDDIMHSTCAGNKTAIVLSGALIAACLTAAG